MAADAEQEGAARLDAPAQVGVVEQVTGLLHPFLVQVAALAQQILFPLPQLAIEALAGTGDVFEVEAMAGKLALVHAARVGDGELATKGAQAQGSGAFEELVQALAFGHGFAQPALGVGDGGFLAVDGEEDLGAVEGFVALPVAVAHLQQAQRVLVQLAHGVVEQPLLHIEILFVPECQAPALVDVVQQGGADGALETRAGQVEPAVVGAIAGALDLELVVDLSAVFFPLGHLADTAGIESGDAGGGTGHVDGPGDEPFTVLVDEALYLAQHGFIGAGAEDAIETAALGLRQAGQGAMIEFEQGIAVDDVVGGRIVLVRAHVHGREGGDPEFADLRDTAHVPSSSRMASTGA